MVEQSISIAYLKYFAADRVLAAGGYVPPKAAATGKRVGVIGGGPRRPDRSVLPLPEGQPRDRRGLHAQDGGMLRYGIPEYRLPKKVLDQEIDEIASLGVEMKNNFRIGEQMSFEEFKSQYDAVVLAIGAWSSTPIGCPGEELEGVMGGIDFLRQVAMGEKPTSATRSPWSAAATPPWTPAARPCVWGPKRSMSSIDAPRRRCPLSRSRSTKPAKRAWSISS